MDRNGRTIRSIWNAEWAYGSGFRGRTGGRGECNSTMSLHGSLRLSLSEYNTEEEIDHILAVTPGIVEYLRNISPVWDELEHAPLFSRGGGRNPAGEP